MSDVIIHEDGQTDYIYIIIEGQVDFVKSSRNTLN